MRIFECQHCGQLLFFQNTRCERCERRLGYLPGRTVLSALEPVDPAASPPEAIEEQRWRPLAAPNEQVRLCANAAYNACNWLLPADSPHSHCPACRLNRTIPNLSTPRHQLLWQRLETAKHRLVYGLLRLRLPVVSQYDDPETGLFFDFLTDSGSAFQEAEPVITGHARGVITIDLAEADNVERERHRRELLETYRTLLGHFRHEVGHYYWERLVQNSASHTAVRDTFGDERQDYSASLARHYANGAPEDWQERHISRYASAHPWEDFAETWAHYLHIVDTLETAATYDLRIDASAGRDPHLEMSIDFDPYQQTDFDALIAVWVPLTAAVNSLNQSMGQPDLYPFVLSSTVVGKLRVIHDLIYGAWKPTA